MAEVKLSIESEKRIRIKEEAETMIHYFAPTKMGFRSGLNMKERLGKSLYMSIFTKK